MLAAGKIPHHVDMDKHPEKSLHARMCEFSWDLGSDSQLIVACRVNGASCGFYQGGSSFFLPALKLLC